MADAQCLSHPCVITGKEQTMASKDVLDYTVLDLCEETYHDKLGFTVLDILSHEGGKRFCPIVCINSIRCDNKRTYEMLLEDYACFRVTSFSFDMTVKEIVNMSCARGMPVMSLVEDLGEQCLILAACQQPWADWFAAIFIEGNEQLYEPLQPIITKLLVNYTAQAQKVSAVEDPPSEEEVLRQQKACEAIIEKWMNRPLSPLLVDAERDGCAFERLKTNGRTVMIVVCIVPRTEKEKKRFANEFATVGKKPRSELADAKIGFLFEHEVAYKASLLMAIDNPDSLIFSSSNPLQIAKLEADFCDEADLRSSQIEQLGHLPRFN